MIDLSEIDVKENTNLSEALTEINKDTINPVTGMSDIDMRTRLDPTQIPAILQIDNLVSLNVLPKEFNVLTLQFKRLQVSLFSQGRKELVKIAVGNQELEQAKKGSIFNMLKKKQGDY